MAEKDSGSKATKDERIINIPLRAGFIKVPKNQRANKAMDVIRDYAHRQTKSYEIKVSQKVNEKIWIRGIQKPPGKIKVKISADSGGVVHVRLPEEIVREKKKEDKGRLAKMMETVGKEKNIPGMAGPKEEILKKGRRKGEAEDSGEEEKTKGEEPTEHKEPKEDRPAEAADENKVKKEPGKGTKKEGSTREEHTVKERDKKKS